MLANSHCFLPCPLLTAHDATYPISVSNPTGPKFISPWPRFGNHSNLQQDSSCSVCGSLCNGNKPEGVRSLLLQPTRQVSANLGVSKPAHSWSSLPAPAHSRATECAGTSRHNSGRGRLRESVFLTNTLKLWPRQWSPSRTA